jgi:hypothetical protein
MAKTRTPANNRKNFRRARAIKRLEASLPSVKDPVKLASRKAELEHAKKIQSAKGGSL